MLLLKIFVGIWEQVGEGELLGEEELFSEVSSPPTADAVLSGSTVGLDDVSEPKSGTSRLSPVEHGASHETGQLSKVLGVPTHHLVFLLINCSFEIPFSLIQSHPTALVPPPSLVKTLKVCSGLSTHGVADNELSGSGSGSALSVSAAPSH